MNKKYVKSLNTDNLSNLIVRKINENSSSYLKGKITTDEVLLKKHNTYLPFDVLSSTIEYSFAPESNKEVAQFSNKIINGLNHIIDNKPELLDGVNNILEWSLYINLIHYAIEEENWKEIIETTVGKLNINDVDIKTINKNSIKKMNEYVQSLVNMEVR
jgi:hypothetical protein